METEMPIWKTTLEQLEAHILAGDSLTGGVAVAAVSAALASSVLQMALEIAVRKRESERARELIELTKTATVRLAGLADEDRGAYAAYLEARRQGSAEQKRAALRRATLTPLTAIRAAVAVLRMCGEAAGLVQGQVAADVGGAAALLAGAVRAILYSFEANLRLQVKTATAGKSTY
ncbi:MAG: hypothetical protein C5B51_29620 [Terriglobia bacterium]|nr:MAG: hypothetical protein C5B51_29620 [Terriglobia bacterium]